MVSWIVGALEGATIIGSMSALGAGLFSIGIPNDSIVKYETAIKSDKFLLVAHGLPEDVQKAKNILTTKGTGDITVHHGAESA